MSFIHADIVGHFDPGDCSEERVKALRPIDEKRARDLLAEFSDKVTACVSFEDGYAWCQWSAGPAVEVMEFSKRLAEQERCVILRTPDWACVYPHDAARRQAQMKLDPLPPIASTD